jgi:glucose/mannose-6-phosphate isomerase
VKEEPLNNQGNNALDDLKLYGELDKENMLGHLHDFPQECEKAFEMAKNITLPSALSEIDNVVILGMGGSAIGGDLVSSLVTNECKVPVQVCRGYSLPGYAGKLTLVVSSSYSGNTEETLSCFEQSLKAGAQNLVITTGGKLKELAEKNKVPVFLFDYKSPPRAALPYSFVPLLVIMRRLGLSKTASDYSDIKEAITLLKTEESQINETAPESVNPAKKIARKLHDRLAVIYGAEMVAEVAHRWKTQINENSKAWAFYEVLPELNHNSVVGYEYPAELRRKFLVVMLNSEFLSPRVKLRYDTTKIIMEKSKVEFEECKGTGKSPLADMMYLILLGDYISYYLAILYGTEPAPVKTIDFLKNELAKHK